MKMPAQCLPKLFMKFNGVSWGKGLKLYGIPYIFKSRSSKLSFGTNCTVNSSMLSNLIGLYQRTVIVSRCGATVEIGNNVGMSGVTIYARNKITIGDNTLIGANVKILAHDFHPIEIEARNAHDKSKITSKPIDLGKNCFIGCNALILKGTTLGEGCVVGAGAVVSGKFPDNSVIVGNPGKIIKTLEVDDE